MGLSLPEKMGIAATERRYQTLLERLEQREARVVVMGAGYVGLTLAVEAARIGFPVTCYEIDPAKVTAIRNGISGVPGISAEELKRLQKSKRLVCSNQPAALSAAEVIVICVATPLNGGREPDTSQIETAATCIRYYLKPGTLVILESTSYPGTTEELVKPILEASALKAEKDFWLAFSPERVDPGNPNYGLHNTPKVLAGIGEKSTALTQAFYSQTVEKTVTVSSPTAAEMVKLHENTFRNINIAFVNEMALLCDRMGLDIWEIIQAASSKPYGFMPFHPGPGPGGHCIPVDPHYLSWKARQHNFDCKFIELASSINDQMPNHVRTKTAEALKRANKSLNGAKVLLLGAAYKRDIADTRESPIFRLISLFRESGAQVTYHDPLVAELRLADSTLMESVELTPETLAGADCVIILVDHTGFDYQAIVTHSRLVLDCRNVCSSLSAPHLASLWSGGNGTSSHPYDQDKPRGGTGTLPPQSGSAPGSAWPHSDSGNGGNGSGSSQAFYYDSLSGAQVAGSIGDCALADVPLGLPTEETQINGEGTSVQMAIRQNGMHGWRALMKRLMDMGISAGCLLVLSPLLAVVALAIKITSRGPVFFRQQRVGKGGRLFWMYKFRSMYADAEERLKSVLPLNQASGPIFKIRNDPRITPLGNILRRASIDELPQLWNVLKGEMSLVGPRPPLSREVREYGPRECRRLEVKPGITCLWQVSGRSELSFQRWVELDLRYIEHQSLLLDMAILARTPLAVISTKGAY